MTDYIKSAAVEVTFKRMEQEMAGMEWPLLFLTAWVFIMKMQFHSISRLAQPHVAV